MNNNLIQANYLNEEKINVKFQYNSQKKISIYSKFSVNFEERKFALKIYKYVNNLQSIYSGQFLYLNNN